MRIAVVLAALSLAGIAPATAQEAKGECFQIIAPVAQSPQPNFLMLNKCTGATWMLVKTIHPDSTKDRTSYTYIWLPLQSGNRQPQLSN